MQYSLSVLSVPLKPPSKDKLPSALTVALCGILTLRPRTLYIRCGIDLKISASKRKAATAVSAKAVGSKTSSVIDVSSKELSNKLSELSTVVRVTVTVRGKSESSISSGKKIM